MRILKPLASMASFKLIWQRITFSKITTSFFLIALLHCVIQVALETFAFSINEGAITFLKRILIASTNGTTEPSHSVAIFANNNLTVCDGIPSSSSCKVIWSWSPPVTNAVNVSDVPAPYGGYDGAVEVTTASTTATTTTAAPSFTAGGFEVVPSPAAVVPESGAATPTVTVVFPGSQLPAAFALTDVDGHHHDIHQDLNDALADSILNAPGGSGIFKRAPGYKRDATVFRKLNATGGFVGVLVVDPRLKGGQFLASPACIASLEVPIQSLRGTKRVDLVFIAFQIWVLGMSTVALLNESVPHILASLLTHFFAAAWSGYQLRMTNDFQKLLNRLVLEGPCQANLLTSEYWGPRRQAEIAVASLNAAVLVAVAVLSYMLVKSFGWQTFKRIGASLVINRIYRLVLAFSITIQLSVFFIGANVTLWIDQLLNGNIAPFAAHRILYEVVFISVLAMLLPWLTIGWFAVRRESRFWMHTFIVVGFIMISGWTMMFVSTTFRWTFLMWDFFAFVTVVAAVLLACTIALGIWCRLNFGKGLPRYLNSDVGDPDEPAFEDMDAKSFEDEKSMEFPGREGSPMTYSVAFGQGAAVLPALQRLGAAPGISMHARGGSITEPPAAAMPPGHARTDSGSSHMLSRSETVSSTSSNSRGGDSYRGRQRWLIE